MMGSLFKRKHRKTDGTIIVTVKVRPAGRVS